MYEIYTSNNPKCTIEFHIDKPNITAIPSIVSLGIGNKKKRYDDYLENSIKDTTTGLFRYLAFIHKTGLENGCITLICKCSYKEFHAKSIKEFLIRNEETLTTLVPYLFPDSGYKAKTNEELDDPLTEVEPNTVKEIEKVEPVIINNDGSIEGKSDVVYDEALTEEQEELLRNVKINGNVNIPRADLANILNQIKQDQLKTA